MLLAPLLRFPFARAAQHRHVELKEIHRQDWTTMKNYLSGGKFLEAHKLICQLDDKVSRDSFFDYMRYLTNKVIVEFKLRKYGSANLALKNIFLFHQRQPLPSNFIERANLQLLTLQFLYQRDRQPVTSKRVELLIKGIQDPQYKTKVKYFYAMSLLNQGRYTEGVNRLIEIINHQPEQFEDVEYLRYYKQMSFISMITSRVLYKAKFDQPPGPAIKLVKDYINQGKIEAQQLQKSNPLVIYQQYSQYQSMFPDETKYFTGNVLKLDAMIAEGHLADGNFDDLYKQLGKLEGTIFQPWLKGQKFMHQAQYSSAMQQFKNTVEHTEVSPQFDVLKYEALKYMVQIATQQKDEAAQQIRIDAEEFRMSSLIEPGTEHLPYFLLPYQQVFGVEQLEL